MRLVFLGYQNIGHRSLRALIDLTRQYGDEIVAVITHADDPGENIWFDSVRDLAFTEYLPVYQPADPNDPRFVAVMQSLAPDFIFSCYYRAMLKKPFLDLASRGALNLHGSLLPRYRGKCPINWVLIHGETETGVTLHYMEEKPDRGDIVAQQPVSISPDDTAFTLNQKMAAAAEALWRDVYPALRDGSAPRRPQDHSRASYFGGRRPADGLIDWQQSSGAIFNLVRAVTHPYPGAFTHYRGKKFFVWAGRPASTTRSFAVQTPGSLIIDHDPAKALLVQTGQDLFQITRGQFEGEPELSGQALAKRFRECTGRILGETQN